MDKVLPSVDEAIADIKDGAMIAVAGFFTCGVPRALLQALIKKGTKNLTLTCGCGPLVGASEELTALTLNGQLKKVIDSYGLYRSASKGAKDPFEQALRAGKIELEVFPMGTMAEKYRAGGAVFFRHCAHRINFQLDLAGPDCLLERVLHSLAGRTE